MNPASEHLTAFTIDEIIRSTTRPNEPPDQRTNRAAAIREMYHGFAPRDAIEGMVVAQIIGLRFLVADAMEKLSRSTAFGEPLLKAQQSVNALNRLLLSWVRQLEQRRARETKQAASTAKARTDSATAKAPAPTPPASPTQSPSTPAVVRLTRDSTPAATAPPHPVANGQAGAPQPQRTAAPATMPR